MVVDKGHEGMADCIFWRKKFIASLTRLPDSALILRTFSPQFMQGEVCGQGSSSASATALEKLSSENNLPNGWKNGAVF